MAAALRLSRSQPVILVDDTGTFIERIRLHEAAAGRPPRAIPLAELVATRPITIVTARAVAIYPAARTVHLDSGTVLDYRTLVYALGSATDTRSSPGVGDHALTLEQARTLNDRLTAGSGQRGNAPEAVATAMPSGAHAAEAVEAAYRGQEPQMFRFHYVGQAISLGSENGVFQVTRADDSPCGPVITGRLAAWGKNIINRYTLGGLRSERRRPGSYRWAKGRLRPPARRDLSPRASARPR